MSLILLGSHTAYAQPITIPTAVTAPIDGDGHGMCISSAISNQVSIDFGNTTPDTFNGRINGFMETHIGDRVENTLQTNFDLSNNNLSGLASSLGDFLDSGTDGCQSGGCPIFVDDPGVSYGSRIRGFLNVTEDLAGQEIHIGLFADDAISVTFFDKDATSYTVLVQEPVLGASTWRLTQGVIFAEPGLYPVEILYVEIVEHAALEMSYFIGTFDDFQRPSDLPPIQQLDEEGFTLFEPIQFFQTLSGAQPFPLAEQCQQCNRAQVNLPGTAECPGGYYCNEAALCAPCDSALFCGPSCTRCGLAQPFCIDIDGMFECSECEDDNDCTPGNICNDQHQCVPCSTADSCAGNSCNCCPAGSNGQPMQCAVIDLNGPPVCVECTSNADCPSGVCDVLSGHCLDAIPENRSSDCCGEDCVACPDSAQFCVPSPIDAVCAECRWDTDCTGVGEYCLSGVCRSCTTDRRCGVRCLSCGGDTPYCSGAITPDNPERAECVECVDDVHCPGGTCNPLTNLCDPPHECVMSCAMETPFCLGDQCVECYADTQCPCNGTCDPDTFTCSESCKTNRDCLGNEHCIYVDDGEARDCTLGPLFDDTTCGSTLNSACAIGAAGRRGSSVPWTLGLIMLAVLVALRRRRPTSQSSTSQRGES